MKVKRAKKTKSTFNDGYKFSDLACIAAKAAEEKKGENILLLDVSKLTIIADYFLIITANSTAQIEALGRSIEEKLSKYNCKLISKEGISSSNWSVLDFGNIIVHILQRKEREFYRLEGFWSNATLIDNRIWEKAS